LMCPSFRATREEEHSTRGRARLLWEMTRGDAVTGQWQDEDVKKSLDLCLSCKGCKTECPVGVDVATYKSEFLSHYYEGHSRPLRGYAFGHIDRWARLASVAPWLANFFTHAPGLRNTAKWITGIPQQRQIPKFASRNFVSWFHKRSPKSSGLKPVIL